MATYLDPGPYDGHVLSSQSDHRAYHIWAQQEVKGLKFRRGALVPDTLAPVIQRRLAVTGFLGVHYIGRLSYDWGLLEALVERWRPETHSFHLPPGETTITLQDMGMLSGLPIDGFPLTDSYFPAVRDWRAVCGQILGVIPGPGDIDGSSMKLLWLKNSFPNFATLEDDSDPEVVDRYTRAYIMLQLGGNVFSDRSNSKVKLRYLLFLRNIEMIRSYSWGSAALAFLYRELCSATRPTTSQCGGYLNILQLWAWERLLCTQPISCRVQEVDYSDKPLGYRWIGPLSTRSVTSHNLLGYRDQLANLHETHIVWEPYEGRYAPDYCLQGHGIWRSRVPLICFEKVEWHYPDRVMRQFGMLQEIPVDCSPELELHQVDLRGNDTVVWSVRHQQYLRLWDERRNFVVNGRLGYQTMHYTHPYMVWYRNITCMFVQNPADTQEFGYQPCAPFLEGLVQQLQRVYVSNESGITRDQEHGYEVCPYRLQVQGQVTDALTFVREQQRLNAAPPPPPVDRSQGVVPRQHRQRRPRARPQPQPEMHLHDEPDPEPEYEHEPETETGIRMDMDMDTAFDWPSQFSITQVLAGEDMLAREVEDGVDCGAEFRRVFMGEGGESSSRQPTRPRPSTSRPRDADDDDFVDTPPPRGPVYSGSGFRVPLHTSTPIPPFADPTSDAGQEAEREENIRRGSRSRHSPKKYTPALYQVFTRKKKK